AHQPAAGDDVRQSRRQRGPSVVARDRQCDSQRPRLRLHRDISLEFAEPLELGRQQPGAAGAQLAGRQVLQDRYLADPLFGRHLDQQRLSGVAAGGVVQRGALRVSGYRRSELVMGTMIALDIADPLPAATLERLADDCFDWMREVDARFSTYRGD